VAVRICPAPKRHLSILAFLEKRRSEGVKRDVTWRSEKRRREPP